jgi:hypothetical protein
MKTGYKSIMLATTFITILHAQAHHTQTPIEKIKFENSILKLVDGIPFCMDGDSIKKMVIVTAIFKHMLYGTDPKTKKYAPRYDMNNKRMSISEFTMLEAAEPATDLSLKLEEALLDFYKEIQPFLHDAKIALEYNLPLIEEWMEKTQRHDTELYDIHDCQEGKELEHLKSRITSFEKLSTLLEDLISYFESLIHSCPKGVAQFKEIMRQRHIKS